MIKFKNVINLTEEKNNKSIHFFDMDETLFTHDHNKLRVHVKDQNGKRTRSLTNQEFNTHTLPANHSYDFSEFRSSRTFIKSAKPIRKMIAKLKEIKNNGAKTAILTARADLDDQPKFAHHMNKFGIDIQDTHVHRAGNLSGKPADNKAEVVRQLVKKHGYNKVHLYDDSEENLNKLLKLKKEFPEVEFHAHHVQHDSETDDVKITKKEK